MLGEFEERLSGVPRWSLIRTIQKQSVADHSFRVALIAPRFAYEYFGVDDKDYKTLYATTRYALLHDQYEAFSGDMASMVKDCIDELKLVLRYDKHVKEGYDEVGSANLFAVKLADLYEACVFLATEIGMGNNSVQEAYDYMKEKTSSFMKKQGLKDHWVMDSIKQFENPTRTMDLRDLRK